MEAADRDPALCCICARVAVFEGESALLCKACLAAVNGEPCSRSPSPEKGVVESYNACHTLIPDTTICYLCCDMAGLKDVRQRLRMCPACVLMLNRNDKPKHAAKHIEKRMIALIKTICPNGVSLIARNVLVKKDKEVARL